MTTREITYVIRPGEADDVPGVDALLERCYPALLKADYPPSVMVTAVPLISRAQPALITCGTYYVADAGPDGIIGAGGWTIRDPGGVTDPSRASIRHFATDPTLLRKGIAHQLMRRCIEDSTAAGLQGMTCYSTRTAVPFYRAEGFAPRAEVELELRAGIRFPAIRMERDL